VGKPANMLPTKHMPTKATKTQSNKAENYGFKMNKISMKN